MLYDLALGLFSIAMVVGGVYMMKDPERFITSANPTLKLLEKHLPEGWAERVVQVGGAMLVCFFIAYLYIRYVM